MKQLVGTLLLIVWLPLLAMAQGSDYSKGHGYLYAAPGVRDGDLATIQFGGGAEGFFIRGLGLGADLGGLKTSGVHWLGTLSPNVVARFRAKDDENKVEPFVTGGYTLFFHTRGYTVALRSASVTGYNFGGGINYWFHDHFGLRFEARDSVWVVGDGTDFHFVGLRIGLMFR